MLKLLVCEQRLNEPVVLAQPRARDSRAERHGGRCRTRALACVDADVTLYSDEGREAMLSSSC